MLVTFRFISTLLVHIIISLVILGLLFVCGVFWWLYYDYTNDLSTELDTEKENMKCMLAFAVITTVVTVSIPKQPWGELFPERAEVKGFVVDKERIGG